MHYLNVEMNIKHRHFSSSSVYLNLEDDKIKAYVGNFELALSDETPSCLKNACMFEYGMLRWKVEKYFYLSKISLLRKELYSFLKKTLNETKFSIF